MCHMGQKYNYYRLLMGWRVIEPWSKFRSGSEIRRGRSATLAGIVLEIEGNDVPSKELACTERRITSMNLLILVYPVFNSSITGLYAFCSIFTVFSNLLGNSIFFQYTFSYIIGLSRYIPLYICCFKSAPYELTKHQCQPSLLHKIFWRRAK